MSSKSVNHVKGARKAKKSQQGGQQPVGPQPKCKNCGHVHPDKACKAKDHTCKAYKQKGHFWHCCPQKKDKSNAKKLDQIKIRNVNFNKQAPKTVVQFKSQQQEVYKSTKMTPDSAAEGTVAGLKFLKALGIKPEELEAPQDKLVGVTGTQLKCIGTCMVKFKLNNKEVEDVVYICPDESGVLLAWYVCQGLGILHKDYPGQLDIQKVTVPDSLDLLEGVPATPSAAELSQVEAKLKHLYRDVFDQDSYLPIMDGPPMKIHLKPEAKPYNQISARAVPYALREAVKKELDKMVALGVAEPMGDQPSTWCHPLVVVAKKEQGAPSQA